MDRKILFFDIDGTLIGRSRVLLPSTMEAIQRAKEKGYLMFISTGRALASIYRSIRELGFDGYITSAGSIIYVGDQSIYEHYLDRLTVKKITSLFSMQHIQFTLETKHALYQTDRLRDFFDEIHREDGQSNQELERMQEAQRKFVTGRRFAEYHDDIPVSKVTFVSLDKQKFAAIRPFFEDQFNIVMFSEPDKRYCNGELIDRSCTKGHAVKRICDYYGISLENSIAFGDSMNDYEMLQIAGTSVVFKGAADNLRALGNYFLTTPTMMAFYM